MTNPHLYALIVAGGAGARMGGAVPKQYQPLLGAPMLCHALRRFLEHPQIAGVMAVIRPEDAGLYQAAIPPLTSPPQAGGIREEMHAGEIRKKAQAGEINKEAQKSSPPFTGGKEGGNRAPAQAQYEMLAEKLLPPTAGGATRQDSVRYGLEALAPLSPDFVLIHDAARPLLSAALITRVIRALDGVSGIVPALPVVDTIRSETGETLARETLKRIQTPQAFPFARILALHQQVGRISATDDAALWIAAGGEITYVTGEERNRKMTHAEDTALMGLGVTRVGMGVDVHRLIAGDGVMLGGIRIPAAFRLEGHSDADVVLHAVVDALLGAIGEGDIGQHFPPHDVKWRGADSSQFIAHAAARLEARGAQLVHLDITIICELPKIAPHREAMRLRIASLLNVAPEAVSVKATTTEGLGFTGRGEGIVAQALATVVTG